MESQAWSIVFYFEHIPNEYRAFVLSPHARYKNPQEWEDRHNTNDTVADVKLVDYRPLSDAEYNEYYRRAIKNYEADFSGIGKDK